METLRRKSSFFKPYFIDDMQVSSITFYSNNGIVCTTRFGYLQAETGEEVNSVMVCNIKRVRTIRDKSKRTLKAEQLMKEEINFCISLGTNDFNEKRCELYLYVDNDIIKHLSTESIVKTSLSQYTLKQYTQTTITDTFNISNIGIQVVNKDITAEVETDYSASVNLLHNNLDKLLINISSSDVAKLFNYYTLTKREIPLTEQFRRESSTEIISKKYQSNGLT